MSAYERNILLKKDAKDAVVALSKLVNIMGHDVDEFVDLLMREHRTLQQQIFNLMMASIQRWADAEHYDGRNEFTVLKCRELKTLFDTQEVPFI